MYCTFTFLRIQDADQITITKALVLIPASLKADLKREIVDYRRFCQLSAAHSQSSASQGMVPSWMEQMDAGTISKALWCHCSTLYNWQKGTKDRQSLMQTPLLSHMCPARLYNSLLTPHMCPHFTMLTAE